MFEKIDWPALGKEFFGIKNTSGWTRTDYWWVFDPTYYNRFPTGDWSAETVRSLEHALTDRGIPVNQVPLAIAYLLAYEARRFNPTELDHLNRAFALIDKGNVALAMVALSHSAKRSIHFGWKAILSQTAKQLPQIQPAQAH